MFTKNIPLWLSLMLALLPPLYILLIVAHLLRPKMIRDKSQQVWVAEPLPRCKSLVFFKTIRDILQ